MHKQLIYFARRLVFFLSLCAALQSNASTIEYVGFEDLTTAAELIFEGRVVHVQSQWNAQGSSIFTFVDFQIDDVIKGDYTSTVLRLSFLGGHVADQEMRVEGMVYPQLGERGIYFVSSLQTNMVNPLIGWSQGHYKLDENNLVVSNANQAVVRDRSTQIKPSGTLSRGVAGGLVASSGSGMSKADFKQQIKDVLDLQR